MHMWGFKYRLDVQRGDVLRIFLVSHMHSDGRRGRLR